MPLYDYECDKCGGIFEAYSSIADRDNMKCPECGGGSHVIMSPTFSKREEAPWFRTLNGYLNDLEKVRKGQMRPIETRSDYKDYINHLYRDPHPKVQELRKRYLERA